MKQVFFAIVLAAFGTGMLVVAEKQQIAKLKSMQLASSTASASHSKMIHAAGRVEGKTETVLIRPQFPGKIESVQVTHGAHVEHGQTLFQLDTQRYAAQRDLATANLAAARARKMRLIEGARDSEIESAKHNAVAAEARYEGARSRLERAQKLFQRNAVSPQGLEDVRADHDANLAILQSARQRLETVRAVPRKAELMSADAEIASAEAQLRMATIDLERCSVVSPCSAVVLTVDVNPGEWISPEMEDPALQLANTEQLRVAADVDERDAMQVFPGQHCQITADALTGQSFTGTVAEIEPRMEPKKIYGGWAGERHETHARRVWINIESDQMLPVGLPVEVMISLSEN